MMKRTIIVAIAAAAALFALSSCQKETPIASISAENVEFNITVGDPAMYGEGTKAVRTSWEAGEQILLFLHPTDNTIISSIPQLKLTYDGTKWNGSMSDADLVTALSGTYKKFDGVYFPGDITAEYSSTYTRYEMSRPNGGPVAICSGTYSLTESAGKFTFSANLSFYTTSNSLGTFQVVVPGISVSDGYILYIYPNKDTTQNGIYGITNVLYKGFASWACSSVYFCNGIANADGVAYYPKYWSLRLDDATGYTFKLTNGSTTKYLYFDKDAGHTLANGKAIKLPNISSWSDTKPE